MHAILLFVLLFNFSFAQTQEEKTKEASIHSSNTKQVKEFENIGLSITNNKIILDMNQTKKFFKNFIKSVNSLNSDIIQTIQSPQKVGVNITKEHINIDINQSQKYLKSLEDKMQNFLKDFETLSKEMGVLEK